MKSCFVGVSYIAAAAAAAAAVDDDDNGMHSDGARMDCVCVCVLCGHSRGSVDCVVFVFGWLCRFWFFHGGVSVNIQSTQFMHKRSQLRVAHE